VEAKDKQEQGQ